MLTAPNQTTYTNGNTPHPGDIVMTPSGTRAEVMQVKRRTAPNKVVSIITVSLDEAEVVETYPANLCTLEEEEK